MAPKMVCGVCKMKYRLLYPPNHEKTMSDSFYDRYHRSYPGDGRGSSFVSGDAGGINSNTMAIAARIPFKWVLRVYGADGPPKDLRCRQPPKKEGDG